jgi:hypothetical protein
MNRLLRKAGYLVLFMVAVLALAACGGAVGSDTTADISGVGNASGGDTVVRVKESASLATAPQLLSVSNEEGPANRGATGPTSDVAAVCLNPEEAELARQVNAYRASLSLPPLQISKSLSLVAQQHVWDSINNRNSYPPAPAGKTCNMHSWSGIVNPALQQGTWTANCYTSDHANAEGMWNKPREIAGFPGEGVENSFGSSGSATALGALTAWKNSPGHNNVITQQGGWGPMAAMGVGLSGGFAHLWLSSTADPAGEAPLCGGGNVNDPTPVPPTAVPPTAVPPTAVPPTAVPPTATAVPEAAATDVPAATIAPTAVPPTAVPPTAVPPTVAPTAAAPTGVILNENGTVTAGSEVTHQFSIFSGRTYTIVVSPSAEFDAAPRLECSLAGGGSTTADFDWRWEGEEETFEFNAPGNSNGNCRVIVGGYQGSTGTYTIRVTAR